MGGGLQAFALETERSVFDFGMDRSLLEFLPLPQQSLVNAGITKIVGRLRRLWVILSLILATLWVPLSSHAFLQGLGLIHDWHGVHGDAHDHDAEASHEHDGGHHDLADGICRNKTGSPSLELIASAAETHLPVDVVNGGVEAVVIPNCDRAGLPPPGNSPPELFQKWRFSLRAALPVRAPSSLS